MTSRSWATRLMKNLTLSMKGNTNGAFLNSSSCFWTEGDTLITGMSSSVCMSVGGNVLSRGGVE